MSANELDPRVAAGMQAQLRQRATRIASGAARLGWKAGFGAPAALQRFGLPGPLVGYMLQDARVASGGEVSVSGWAQPVAEPEIAVWLGEDLADGADRDAVRRAISAIGPAIELADLSPPPEDVARILAGNIFHRHVLLGRADTQRGGADLHGISGQVTRNGVKGEPIGSSSLEVNTGRVVDVVGHMATTLARCGEGLKRGDVIICGSVVPPLFLDRADVSIAFALAGIGEVSVRIAVQ